MFALDKSLNVKTKNHCLQEIIARICNPQRKDMAGLAYDFPHVNHVCQGRGRGKHPSFPLAWI